MAGASDEIVDPKVLRARLAELERELGLRMDDVVRLDRELRYAHADIAVKDDYITQLTTEADKLQRIRDGLGRGAIRLADQLARRRSDRFRPGKLGVVGTDHIGSTSSSERVTASSGPMEGGAVGPPSGSERHLSGAFDERRPVRSLPLPERQLSIAGQVTVPAGRTGPQDDLDPASSPGPIAGAAEIQRLTELLGASQRALADRDDRIRELAREVAELGDNQSLTVVWVRHARRAVRVVAPIGSHRQRALSSVLQTARPALRASVARSKAPTIMSEVARYRTDDTELTAEYRRWRAQHEPGPEELDGLRRTNETWEGRPLVSVLLPVVDAEAGWVEATVDSVVTQTYGEWELSISLSGSIPPDVDHIIEQAVASDARVRLVRSAKGAAGIDGADDGMVPAQRAAVESVGEWVVRVEAGDLLRPEALQRIVEHLTEDPACDVVYGDEDRMLASGDRVRPEFKPDWSPDYLLSRDYIGRPTAIRRSLLASVGGWRSGFAPAQEDHDLHLRATEQARGVGHVAGVLCSRPWRTGAGARYPGSHGTGGVERPVAAALERRGLRGRVTVQKGGEGIGGEQGVSADLNSYDLRFAIEGTPSVDIIIPTRDRLDLLKNCISSIRRVTTYPSYRVTVVDNDSVEEATHRYLAQADVHVVPCPGPFNFSRLVNTGVRASDADYVLLLNNDITAITDDWIEALLELAQQPDVGAVGCRLLFPDGSVQHEGVALLPEYTAANISWPWPVIRDASAVTAACMLIRREVFWSVDGFDEDIAVCFNDVDFCLRLGRTGRRVVYTPHAELEHAESATRGRTNPPADIDLFFNRWGTPDRLRDPFVSPYVRWPHPQRLRIWK